MTNYYEKAGDALIETLKHKEEIINAQKQISGYVPIVALDHDQNKKRQQQSRDLMQGRVQEQVPDLKRRHDLHGELDQERKVRKLERMKCDMCRADKQKVHIA
jgi:hypothetical protein